MMTVRLEERNECYLGVDGAESWERFERKVWRVWLSNKSRQGSRKGWGWGVERLEMLK